MAERKTSRIVVVDDSPELLASMSRILRADGHRVYGAQSGADGLRLAREHLPDLMIVDVVLPDMDGFEVYEQVQADEKLSATSVILVSSVRVDSAHRAEGLERGVCEYIARPMPNREFLARVETVLRDKRVLDEEQESRVELEQELQTIFSNAPVCLFLTDPEARLTRTNPAFKRLFPQSSGTAVGQLCGQAFRCAHAHDAPEGCGHGHDCPNCVVRNAVRDTVRTGTPRVQVQGVLTVEQGPEHRERMVELSTSRVEVRGAPRVIVCMLDVTERVRAQRERASLQQQLQQAQRMESVGRLAGGVAHDFNNLLSVILGYAFMLDEQLSNEGALREPLEEITSAGLRAKDLTRQLLAFSRRQVLEVKPVDLNQVTRGFTKLMRRLIGEDVALVLELASEPLVIQGDPAQLEQVLMNLTVNARDAMPNGGTLTIRTTLDTVDGVQTGARPDLEPGRYGALRVQDTGCGVPPELLGSIFEPFFTTKEKEKGTGLGLSTTHGIVEQHGGAIEVDSEPGVGTTFTLCFPPRE